MLGDYLCLMKAVRGKCFTRRTIVTAFKKFISTDDYDLSDYSTLIKQLMIATNAPEDDQFKIKNE